MMSDPTSWVRVHAAELADEAGCIIGTYPATPAGDGALALRNVSDAQMQRARTAFLLDAAGDRVAAMPAYFEAPRVAEGVAARLAEKLCGDLASRRRALEAEGRAQDEIDEAMQRARSIAVGAFGRAVAVVANLPLEGRLLLPRTTH